MRRHIIVIIPYVLVNSPPLCFFIRPSIFRHRRFSRDCVFGKFLSVCGKLLDLDPDLSQFCRRSTQSDKRSFFKRDRAVRRSGRFLSANKLNIYTRDLHANETNGASHPRDEEMEKEDVRRE